jgi:hypothetical protein
LSGGLDHPPADYPPADRDLAEYTAEGMLLAVSARGERLRLEALARYAARLAALSEEQRDAVDAVTRALVARLLVTPAARGTSLAAGPDGARAIRLLRGLYPSAARERPDAPAQP